MIALYDMDGTLFWGDSQLRFARWILRRYAWRRLYLALILPAGVLRACRVLNTEQMKRLFLAYLWRMPRRELEVECQAFCREELIPALYPELVETIRQHQQAGDSTVLCSASPHWWTRCVGEALGFTHSMGTAVEDSDPVPLMPRIVAPGNNKGHHKVERLRDELGITHAAICYTDSAADTPMLEISDKAVLVNPSASLREVWQGRAQILTPAHPKGKIRFILRCLLGL